MEVNIVSKYTHVPTPHDVYIGRGSPLGNPYSHLPSKFTTILVATREEACEQYSNLFYKALREAKASHGVMVALQELEDHLRQFGTLNLVCFCAPHQCHGETIKEYLLSRVLNQPNPNL